MQPGTGRASALSSRTIPHARIVLSLAEAHRHRPALHAPISPPPQAPNSSTIPLSSHNPLPYTPNSTPYQTKPYTESPAPSNRIPGRTPRTIATIILLICIIAYAQSAYPGPIHAGAGAHSDSCYILLGRQWLDSVNSNVFAHYDRAARFYDSLLWLGEHDGGPASLFHQRMAAGHMQYAIGDINASLAMYDSAFQAAFAANDSAAACEALYFVTYADLAHEDYVAALSSCRQALKFITGSDSVRHKHYASLYNFMGIIYHLNNYPTKAIQYYQKAAWHAHRLGSNQVEASLYHNMGSLHLAMDNYYEGLDYEFNALYLLDTARWPNNTQPDAKPAFSRHLRIYAHSTIANLYTEMQLYTLAKMHLKQAYLELNESKNDNEFIHNNRFTVYTSAALYAYHMQEWASMLHHALLAEKAVKANPLLIQEHHTVDTLLAVGYHHTGNVNAAITQLLKYRKRLDSLSAARNPFQMASYDLATRRKEFMLEQKNNWLREDAEKEAQKQRNRTSHIHACFFIATLLVSARILIYQNKQLNHSYTAEKNSIKRLANATDKLNAHRRRFVEEQTITEQNNIVLQQSQTLHQIYLDRVSRSLHLVERLQEALLPDHRLLHSKIGEHFCLYLPRDGVSGDFYWCTPFSHSSRLIAVVDCAGHGVPGALMSLIGTVLLNKIVLEWNIHDPGQVMNALHEQILAHLVLQNEEHTYEEHYSMDVAILEYPTPDGYIGFCGANSSLYVVEQGRAMRYRGEPVSAGSKHARAPFQTTRIPVSDHSQIAIYLTSDGYTDQLSPTMRKIGQMAFLHLLEEADAIPLNQRAALIQERLKQHQGNVTQTDDVCVLGFNGKGRTDA